MSTEATTHLLTAEEFFALPDPVHGGKMELVRGEVITHMAVGGVHGDIALALGHPLRAFARRYDLGAAGAEVGFALQRDPDIVLAPDVAFVAKDKLPEGVLPEGFVEGPPTLAVEVVSPNDLDREINDKVDEYLQFGTERVWVVRPRRKTVTVFRADRTARVYEAGETLTSSDAGFSVEGFELPLEELFA